MQLLLSFFFFSCHPRSEQVQQYLSFQWRCALTLRKWYHLSSPGQHVWGEKWIHHLWYGLKNKTKHLTVSLKQAKLTHPWAALEKKKDSFTLSTGGHLTRQTWRKSLKQNDGTERGNNHEERPAEGEEQNIRAKDLTALGVGGPGENTRCVKCRWIDKWVGRSKGKVEALAERLYEIGYRIRALGETRWKRGRNPHESCKEGKGERSFWGFWGDLCSPQVEKYSLSISRTKHPPVCSLHLSSTTRPRTWFLDSSKTEPPGPDSFNNPESYLEYIKGLFRCIIPPEPSELSARALRRCHWGVTFHNDFI